MANNEIKLTGSARTEFGKGAARRIRRDNKVPAVVYGHGTEPQHIILPGHETLLALRTANALLSIDIDGKEVLALPKDVQRDPIKGFLEHVDLIIVRRGEKVVVDVPVVITGAEREDRIVVQDANSIAIEAEATRIPSEIEYNVAGMEIGDQVVASQLQLPEGAALAVEGDVLILAVAAAPTAEEVEAELDAAVADATDEEKVAEQEAAAEEKSAGEGDEAAGEEKSEGDSAEADAE